MMRRFCDACGKEIGKSYVQDRLTGSRKVRRDGTILEIVVEVTVGRPVP
jgi:hypothetical protein